jgi:programmed cell death protein 4
MEVLEKGGKVEENGGLNGTSVMEEDKKPDPPAVFHFTGEMLDSEEADLIEARPKHKVKRRVRLSSKSEEVVMAEPKSPMSPTKLLKNMSKDRHSRAGRGRGLPKKGGGGGRYTWGKLVDVYDDDSHPKDNKDPNYDSEDDSESYQVVASNVELTPEEFARVVKEIVKDYFEHADPNEVMTALTEYNVKDGRFELVKILITLAMERKPAYKEMSSRLLSVLHSCHYINSRDMTNAFDLLFDELDDLALDSPDAAEVMGNFLARGVADDCIPPSYLTNVHSKELAKSAMKRANVLVNMKHGMARLDNVWGVGGGQWPVKVLTKQVLCVCRAQYRS